MIYIAILNKCQFKSNVLYFENLARYPNSNIEFSKRGGVESDPFVNDAAFKGLKNETHISAQQNQTSQESWLFKAHVHEIRTQNYQQKAG
jgi:hypothetical protein